MSETPNYDPKAVEAKWQARWRDQHTNEPDLDGADHPFYNLMMFPYPSAEGLHVGNLFAFTGADVFGRFQRMRGHQVFEPIGFDAFGIHSENYAIKVGTHPAELIPRNIANFTRQLTRMGGMFSWNHVLSTTDPSYYKWTQWIFLQLYRQGLAYKKNGAVNWCPGCKTVLSNEQVIAGECERCGSTVEQRVLEQWYFRITDYAGRLLANLDDRELMDWSETTVQAQRNWIGRSEGAEISFPVRDAGERIAVYTTRPDTIFGATFMVLAPEHPLVERITTDDARAAVEDYRRQAAARDLVSRKVGDREKTGVATGAFAINPATGAEIPIWIADYVLMEYGTGAIMAVPGHDERDFAFAGKYRLPIVRVIATEGESADTPLDEALAVTDHGTRLVNSDRFDGMSPVDAKPAITAWLAGGGSAEARTQYRLYDWCISRQRYWGPPIPIVYCDACGTVPIPEDQLPVVLPPIDDFRPDDSGISPLARHEEWYYTPCPACGAKARRETDVSDTFLDSAWYFLRYPSSERDDVPFDAARTRRWLPVTSYIGGNEHAVLHLLYSRFITMVLKDAGLIDFEEPFAKFRAHGLIIKDGAKMSKSRGNVVVPDEYMDRWGADTFRTYLMFLGPFQEGGDFRDSGISGPRRFLDKVWQMVTEAASGGAAAVELPREITIKWHQTKQRVTEEIADLRYNTAIAALMELVNLMRDRECSDRTVTAELVQMMAPFAPHFAEECWERLGHGNSIFDSAWPLWNPALTVDDTVIVAVQVNGRTRGTIPIPRDAGEEEARAIAAADPAIARHLADATIVKVIWVPGRLLNYVVRQQPAD